MKKTLILLSLFFGLGITAYSQAVFDFNIKIEKHLVDGKLTADVEITLLKGETPINYIIINGTLISDAVLIESGPVDKTIYTFKDVPEGKYLLKVEDEQKRIAWKQFIIEKE